MPPWRIDADYLGGDPEHPAQARDGSLRLRSDGGLRFDVLSRATPVSKVEVRIEVQVEPAELAAISLGDTNHAQALTRGAAGWMLGGSIGGLIGMATGSRNTILLVAVRRGEERLTLAFATQAGWARDLLNNLQADRHGRGEDPLPSLEELAGDTERTSQERQEALLVEIRDLLREQNSLLRSRSDNER